VVNSTEISGHSSQVLVVEISIVSPPRSRIYRGLGSVFVDGPSIQIFSTLTRGNFGL
jgi:hypothetical protein